MPLMEEMRRQMGDGPVYIRFDIDALFAAIDKYQHKLNKLTLMINMLIRWEPIAFRRLRDWGVHL